MQQPCNRHLKETIAIADRLIELAEEGEVECRDNGCAVVYGVVRDCAYRIRTEAERERTAHQALGQWEEDEL
ncbi:hypothetical protein JW916_10730 [Candidatus Sumerlaeota bacterium]|nr:hypothetical protein [Candidatus Sumerlaeota bacterium]